MSPGGIAPPGGRGVWGNLELGADLVEGQATPDLEDDDLALLGRQERERLAQGLEPRVGVRLEPSHRVGVGRDGLLAEPAAVGAPEQVQRRAPDGSHHEGVRVAR